MEPTVEKIDDKTIQITTPLPPTVETIDIATLRMNRDNFQRQIDEVKARKEDEIAALTDSLNAVIEIIDKAAGVGVEITVTDPV